jgi:hypothetical protein
MKKILRAVAVAGALAFAQSAMAADWAFDAKAGFSLPVGSVWAGSTAWNPQLSMSSAWSGAVPIEIAARYRFTPNVSMGIYFQWGPAFLTSRAFDNIAGTWGSDMRTGLELVYGFTPDSAMNPWFSLGTGWEWTSYGGSGASVTMNGWEYLNIQLGLDFNMAKAFAIGPYVGFFMGSYANIATSGTSDGWGGQVPSTNRAFHGWFQFGVKGTLNL